MANPQGAAGVRQYVQMVRSFSYNARLYLLHIIGMDMIHGTWETLFNLYLFSIGKGIEFIGLRLLVQGIASMVMAVPAGIISDQIGRRWSFILGDGIGAALALVQIFSTSDWVLLAAPVAGALFGNMHGVAEPAFMAENSAERERVHLFSVGTSLRIVAAATGAFLAGPGLALLGAADHQVALYRTATLIGIAWWFLSLVPALLLKELTPGAPAAPPAPGPGRLRAGSVGAVRSYLATIRRPQTVWRFVLIHALVAFGAGFGVRLFNVFMHSHLHASDAAIGTAFGFGNLAFALGALLVPFVVERLGKVNAILVTRVLALPFILLFAFSRELAYQAAPAMTFAGAAYTLRMMLQNMSSPVYDAFKMEQLHPAERATTVGLETLFGGGLGAVAGYLGAGMMHSEHFQWPYVVMAATYAVATFLFWSFFRTADRPQQPAVPAPEALGD